MDIFAGRFVRECFIELDGFELALGILIERADSDVTDSFAYCHCHLPLSAWTLRDATTYVN